MKRIFLFAMLGLLLATPLVSLAQDEIPDSCKISRLIGIEKCDDRYVSGVYYTCSVDDAGVPCGLCCLVNVVYTVTGWIFFLMMALAVILVVIGGATYMLAAGDADKASKGKSMITFSIFGLAIALIARFIPPIVKFIMGVS